MQVKHFIYSCTEKKKKKKKLRLYISPVFSRRRNRKGPLRPGVRDGDDEDDWPAQKHHQPAGGMHTRR